MYTLAPEINSGIELLHRQNPCKYEFEDSYFQPLPQLNLLQAVLEGFVDGILILTEQGEWVYSNECARVICRQLLQSASPSNTVAQEIWRACQSLIESREIFPTQKMIIESEIETADSVTFRLRTRWLELPGDDRPFIVVTLEDRQLSTQNIVISDAQKYGLTPREAEVWLLRRANFSYKEIAAKLYITLNTVKRHMKNIYAKKEALL